MRSFFTHLHVAGNSRKEGNDKGLMELGEEDVVFVDWTNLFHNFIAQ
jgi:hypothetical protein